MNKHHLDQTTIPPGPDSPGVRNRAATGLLLPRLVGELPFNTRIITGLGILFLGVGIAYLVRYGAARRDPHAAGRLASESAMSACR